MSSGVQLRCHWWCSVEVSLVVFSCGVIFVILSILHFPRGLLGDFDTFDSFDISGKIDPFMDTVMDPFMDTVYGHFSTRDTTNPHLNLEGM